MENQIGEALRASQKKNSELIAIYRPDGSYSFKNRNKKGIWEHKKPFVREYQIPENFNTLHRKTNHLVACFMFLSIMCINLNKVPGYANLTYFMNFKPQFYFLT
jgi:hypothetical protein